MVVVKVWAAGGAGVGPPGGVVMGIRSFAAIIFILIFILLFDHYFLIDNKYNFLNNNKNKYNS